VQNHSYKGFCSKTSFETESQGNSKMAKFYNFCGFFEKEKKQRKRRLVISAVTIRVIEQSLLKLLSVFRVRVDA